MKKQEPHNTHLTIIKKRIFFTVTILLPLILFVGLELLLRWAGYGPNLSLFVKQEIRHENFLIINRDVKFRYFGSMKFSPSTSIDYFRMSKPPGTFRIFCLGGSTTVGYPYLFNGSFVSYLRERLEYTFPDKNIEIVNLGMTATNSYTVLDIAKELINYQPDLLIVYDGHNEFYGALGAASNRSLGSSRIITLMYLRLIHLRTFQLTGDIIQKIIGLFRHVDDAESRGTVMETLARDQFVPLESQTYKAAFDIFRDNLLDLKKICASSGISLILGTQVSNLKDQPPFVSNHPSDMPETYKNQFQKLYEHGLTLQKTHLIDSAIVLYQSAEKLDSLYAEVHYRLAQCYEMSKQPGKALYEFRLARDMDELRFRTDSRFNQLIRSMEEPGRCYVADIENLFQSVSPDSLIGHNLIFEHLHPNSYGYFLIAKNYAKVMHEKGIMASRSEWVSADTVNENILWDYRSVADLDEEIAAQNTEGLISSWPFKNQLPQYIMVPETDTIKWIAQRIVMNEIDWRKGHERAIEFYQRRGDLNRVAKEYQVIISQVPLDIKLYFELARIYFKQKKYDNIKIEMLRSIKVDPTLQAYRTLGDVMMQSEDAVRAAKYYERMDDFPQNPNERMQNELALSFAYFKSGELLKAQNKLKSLLSTNPNYLPARQMFNDIAKELTKKK